MRSRTPGGEPRSRAGPDQTEDEQSADHAQLGEGLEVERVGVVDGSDDRAVALPGELVVAGADPSSGFSSKPSIATRKKSWRPAPQNSEKCWLGLVGELDVGAGELVPGAAADRDRRPDRERRRAARAGPSQHRGLRDSSSARPVRGPPLGSSRAAPRRAQRKPIPASRISSTVTPWSTAA